MNLGGYTNPYTAAQASATERSLFIRNTYTHVAGAVLALIALDALLLQIPAAHNLALTMVGSGMSWLVVLGLFMGVSFLANKWAMSDTSRGTQYLGLGIYTVAQAIILLPLLIFAQMKAGGGNDLIAQAGFVTVALFLALTAVVFMTKKDFSFMRSAIVVGSFVAMGIIVAALIFGFSLGLVFMGAMVLLMAGVILYTTSNVLHHYRTDQHVGASLALFSSIATLFWYVLQIFMSTSD